MTEWPRELAGRLAPLALRPEHEAEIIEELAQHLEDRVAELVAGGASPAAARATALSDLDAPGELARRLAEIVARPPLRLPPPGAPAQGRWLRAGWQDLRHSLRSLRRSPAFTATVIVTLGLTIGPTTALLSLGNWLLWRPTPGVSEAARLALVSFSQQTPRYAIVSSMSYFNLDDMRRSTQTLSGLSGFMERRANIAAGAAPPRERHIGYVTADFFDTLGVQMTAGRGLRADDDVMPYGARVAVISHGLARSAFGGDASALNQRVTINGLPMTVVGVLPPGFVGTGPFSRVAAWCPGASYGALNYFPAPLPATRDQGLFNSFIVRLVPGAAFPSARAELDSLLAGLVKAHPSENGGLAKVTTAVTPGLGLSPDQRTRYGTLVRGLLAIGGVLLLLGCANVVNLMVLRGVRQRRDGAVRLALGASRSRIVLLGFTESVILAAGGAAAGLALAFGLKQFVATLLVPTVASWDDFAVPLDARILAMTLGASVGCGLLAGTGSALGMGRTSAADIYRRTRARLSGGAVRLRGALAAAQLALSLALVIGALLLVTTLRHLAAVDLGFDPSQVTVHKLDATAHGYTPARSLAYYQDMLQRVQGSPGLMNVSLSSNAYGPNTRIRVQDVAAGPSGLRVWATTAGGSFFDVMSLPIVAGRVFTDREALTTPDGSPSLVVINTRLARHLYRDADPIGQRVVLPKTTREPAREFTVIGVVGDVRWKPTSDPEMEIYFPLTSAVMPINSVAMLVKSRLPEREVTRRVEAAAMALDPTLPVRYSGPLTAEFEYHLADRTTYAWVLSMLGWLGFALAAVGLYGLLAQSVAERTREFGIRIAVGGDRRHIFALVLRQALWIGTFGVAGGLALAFWGSRLIEAHLVGVTRTAPGIYALAALALLTVVGLASLWPARTATRIAPVDALRVE